MEQIIIRQNETLTKEMLEAYLGYKINNFKIEPIWSFGKQTGLSVMVHVKQQIEYINIDFKIEDESK